MVFKKLNSKGVSIVEVMVALAIAMAGFVALTQLITQSVSIRRKLEIKTALAEVHNNMRAAILNDTSWSLSVNNAANNGLDIACLREATADCADGTGGPTDGRFVLFTAGNTALYDGTDATAGYSFTGAPCTAYVAPPTTGDDSCPFHYNLSFLATCPPGLDPCPKPTVTVTATLEFNPAAWTASYSFNLTDYEIQVTRGSQLIRYEPLEITHFTTANPPASPITGATETDAVGGTCATGGAWNVRKLNQVPMDVGGNVNLNTGTSNFTLQPGTYDCTVRASSYDVGEFRVRLRNTTSGDTELIGTAVTPMNPDPAGPEIRGSASVIGAVNFTLTAASTFVIEQQCYRTARDDAYFSMGYPAAYYNQGNSYTTMFCTRSS